MDRPLDPELDLSEEEVNFLKMLALKIKGNLVIDIYYDELRKNLQESNISLNNFDSLISKMQELGIVIKRINGPSIQRPWISISSQDTQHFLQRVEKVTCPKCNKRTLRIKQVVYCPNKDCDYQRDNH